MSAPLQGPREGTVLRLAPNPLRSGQSLRLESQGDGDRFEIFDLSGRHMADIPAQSENGRRIATVPASITAAWTDGIYFARLRGGRTEARIVVLR